MANQHSAGALRERFIFQRNMAEPNWSGHTTEPDWQDLFTAHGHIQFMRGSEAVIAARLTARQPAILTVRLSANAKSILPSDRVKDARTGEVFNIREKPRISRDSRGYLEMLIEAGVSE